MKVTEPTCPSFAAMLSNQFKCAIPIADLWSRTELHIFMAVQRIAQLKQESPIPSSSMSSTLVIRNKPFKRQLSMFDECVAAQKSSFDIVIYSALASQIVTVAWLVKFQLQHFGEPWHYSRPTYRGVKITPAGIKEWLRARGLHWSCFCGMTAPLGVHLSSRIVHALSGDVFGFCHDEPTSCEFFCKYGLLHIDVMLTSWLVNLTSIYESARFTSEYPLLPKSEYPNCCQWPITHKSLTIDLLPGGRHDALELINLQLGQLVASEVAPYLKGYCGDFISGVEQMSSSRQSFFKSSSIGKWES